MWPSRYLINSILLFYICIAPATARDLVFSSGPQQNTLVELYTSEGCSSCPPADSWLSTLKTHPKLWKQLVPMAFHVDYWNYLGWQDPFSKAAWSERQRNYARGGYARSVYTPGFFTNGREWRTWFQTKTLPRVKTKTIGNLEVTIQGNKFNARFTANPNTPPPAALNVVILGFDLITKVTSGENHGRQLKHDFVVLSHQQISLKQNTQPYLWSATLPPEILQRKEARALAFWVVAEDGLDTLQSVGGWIK